MANVAVIYYSATGNVYALAQGVEQGAQEAGAETRLRKVRELAPEDAIASNQGWQQHVTDTQHVPEATLDDLEWADGFVLGSPTRYGNVAAQLKQFIDQTGPLWSQGKLADKVAAGITSTQTLHGGQESTLLTLYNVFIHWGAIIAAPGYIDPVQFKTGNPYGVSHVSGQEGASPDEDALEAARSLGRRIATLASRLAPVAA